MCTRLYDVYKFVQLPTGNEVSYNSWQGSATSLPCAPKADAAFGERGDMAVARVDDGDLALHTFGDW